MTRIELGLLAEQTATSAVLVMALQLFLKAIPVSVDEKDDILRKIEQYGQDILPHVPINGVGISDRQTVRELAAIRVTDIISAVSQAIRNDGG
ncbi:hypothetical protein KHC28_00265 [Ancylobacter sonchi]|uniref:hypothetical protein n=1 Tax=Ancylobacter sonchi TaxID=1937790 RepID=UPI001BD36E41|nr:hypothetical protein [Ancylobacter sonchi]MBS7532098.1 hypothetical protein [Ancylobacter sonchi]